MLHCAQPTWHFNFLALAASRTVLGNIQCQCAGEMALCVQRGPWSVSSDAASCVGSYRGSLSYKLLPAPPAPSAPSQQCLKAISASCQSQITLQDPLRKYQAPGGHRGTSGAHHSLNAPTNTGSTQESTLGLRFSLASLCPFKMGVIWFLQPLGDREEDLVGFMEGPGIEQNSAMLGQTEPHDHPSLQPASSAHTPSSRAIATLSEPATHLADSRSRQTGWNYQGSPYKLYCTLEASRLGNSDCSTV